MRELAFRVYNGDKPVGAFPTLFMADAYARSQIESMIAHYTPEPQETGYHIGRYIEAVSVAAPMIRYMLTPEGIERFGYTAGSPAIDQVQFERICTQMVALDAEFSAQPG